MSDCWESISFKLMNSIASSTVWGQISGHKRLWEVSEIWGIVTKCYIGASSLRFSQFFDKIISSYSLFIRSCYRICICIYLKDTRKFIFLSIKDYFQSSCVFEKVKISIMDSEPIQNIIDKSRKGEPFCNRKIVFPENECDGKDHFGKLLKYLRTKNLELHDCMKMEYFKKR